MTLQLFNTTSDKRKLHKNKTEIDTISCKIKQGTSILNPIVIINKLSTKKIVRCNYAYIRELQRYYFINDIVESTGQLMELHMHVDVLQSYESDIKSISTLILRQENVYSPYFVDEEMLVRTNRFRTKKNIGVVGGNSAIYYLTVNNGGE